MKWVLQEDALHEAAQRTTGLSDFGDDDYLEALRVLLASVQETARLNEVGEQAFQQMIVAALEARLLSEAGFARHPASAETAIEAPLVIVGLPRTGSTALQHLVSRDPQLQSLELWLSERPRVRPPESDWPKEPDFVACQKSVAALYELSPEMRAIHHMEAHLPDECWHLLAQHFAHSSWEANTDIPTYSKWWADCDMHGAYRRHRRNLQLIGARESKKRWLIKDATHLFHFDAFLDTYPDALVVQTHRDPVKLVASACSLCWSAREPLNEAPDREAFGRSTLALWERAIRRSMEARKKRSPERFYDLHFKEFRSDPLAAIERIYERFDLEDSDAARRLRVEFRDANPPGMHGLHSYSLEEWGLDEGEVRERFADYIEAFEVEPEPQG